jgi:valyl-tRNA synthetase
MSIPKHYDSLTVEQKWYDYWQENGFFHSEPDEREPFTIVIPPPNVTGVLHMGHMLNNTIQDVLVRRARLLGKNACWVPGTDHASIATEAKVVQKLKAEGISKQEIGREVFLKHAWEWTETYGGTIFRQLKRMGASCDWERAKFTLEDGLYQAVIDVFIDLYEKGLIYRGVRMINWDPQALTALSDEEVVYKTVQSKLYYIKYAIKDTEEFLTIATTRPETILGDTAICVHPEDERYRHLHGKTVLVPLINREIPVITDTYVDREFGTGCLKVTPAHDLNDYELGVRHKLKSIDILNDDGSLNQAAELYVEEDRFAVREKIAEDLREAGQLQKTEEIENNVGYSERTDAVIEPKLSLQWFCKMKELAAPALENVENGNIHFHPSNMVNTYRHWMENVKDWCISRQLWWGHRIPAYYYGEGAHDFVIARTAEEALEKAREKTGDSSLTESSLRQDEDVLDTWFSSWLWPISVFDGFKDPDNEDINYYYPTNDLVTAPEIMFFWVARMIMAGYEYRGEKPFRNVYFTGIVRDKQRRKMSKSLGNSPDPMELMDQYGADGVRVGMLLSSPAGNDILFDESLCEQGRNFSNKIWNAFRLVKGWETEKREMNEVEQVATSWFVSVLNKTVTELNRQYDRYRISEALMTTYKLVWDEFCSWYLEMVKPAFGGKISKEAYEKTAGYFEDILRLLHPFMPFISEEIWQYMAERKAEESLIINRWPKAVSSTKEISLDHAKELITQLRNIRQDKQIGFKEELTLYRLTETALEGEAIVKKLSNLEAVIYSTEKPDAAMQFLLGGITYSLPLGSSINPEEEKQKISEEIKYHKGFLQSVEKKLSNERFVNNAPEKVVAVEKKKKEDALKKIELLEKQLETL